MAGSEVFVIVEVQEVFDQQELTAYQAAARQQLLELGGVPIARGDAVFEGEPPARSLLIQKWPSEAAFRAWQESAAYRPLLERRKRAAKLRIAILPAI